jgi:hypothetical protein
VVGGLAKRRPSAKKTASARRLTGVVEWVDKLQLGPVLIEKLSRRAESTVGRTVGVRGGGWLIIHEFERVLADAVGRGSIH